MIEPDSSSTDMMIGDFEVLEKDIIKHITSATISELRKLLLITTANGFVLSDLLKMNYLR
jgi:hypothetical protein